MTKEVVQAGETARPVAIKDIDKGPAHIRTHVNEEDLEELKDSIKKLGLLQPIVVMERTNLRPGQKKYVLVLGSRRVQACEELGDRKEIPAIVIKEQDEERVLAASLAENMFRAPLSHKDTAAAITKLYKLYGKDEKRVAKATGMWPETVLRYVYLQEYGTAKMIDWVQEGKVKLLDVKRMLEAAQWNIKKAERMLQTVIDEEMTPSQRKNFAEFAKENPSATIDDAVEDARTPRVERKLLVDLTPEMREAVERAMKELKMEADEVALQALRDWLEDQGYIE